MNDFEGRVLDHVDAHLGGDLLDYEESFSVGPNLGEHRCEEFDRSRGGSIFDVFEQTVRFFDYQDMFEVITSRLAVEDSEVFDDSDDEGADEERLVLVIGDPLQFYDDVFLEEFLNVERVAALEETARGTGAKASDSHVYESADVGGDLLAVADSVDDVT